MSEPAELMIDWTDEQLAEHGVNRGELEILIRHLQRVANTLEKMGLNIYVAGYTAYIIHPDRPHHTDNTSPDMDAPIAHVPMHIDGGDW